MQSVSQNSDTHFFQIFEKRRMKVASIHQQRREEMINKSRMMLMADQEEGDENQNKQKFIENEKYRVEQNQGESSSAFVDAGNQFFGVQEQEVKNGIEGMSLENQNPHQNQQKPKEAKHIKPKNHKKYEKNYSKLLQTPSWMNTVPQQLHNFYVAARPAGKTCIITFNGIQIDVYDKQNKKVKLNTKLQIDRKKSQNFIGTTLQTIFYEQTNTFFIVDLISWRNQIMTAQTFQFRYAWLLSNTPTQLLNFSLFGNEFKLLQYFPLNSKQNLGKVYMSNFGYEKQGLLLVQKQSPYIHGLNDNVLLWKDAHTSKYPIDQQTQTEMQQNQNYIYGIGKLSKNGNIYSLDNFKLGHIKSGQYEGHGNVRFRIKGLSFNTQNQESEMDIEGGKKMWVKLQGFQVVQYYRWAKGRSDPLSRLISQYRIRYNPLTIEKICSKMQ